MTRRKPTRRDLLIVIGRLQDLAGKALQAAWNDRDPNHILNVTTPLKNACELACEARHYDPPISDSGPWAEEKPSC